MDHLEEAREQVKQSQYREDVKEATYSVHLAIAHALIALVERMDKAAEEAGAAAEREDLIRERLASRQASKRIL